MPMEDATAINLDVEQEIPLKEVLVRWRDGEGNSLLHLNARDGNQRKTIALLRYGCDVNSKNDLGNSVLVCADFSKPRILKILLEDGADVHVTNHMGYNPLELAVQRGNLESVTLMLNAGVEVRNTRNNRSALYIALYHRLGGMEQDNTDNSVLDLAYRMKYESIIKLLLSHVSDVNSEYESGKSPLHFAVCTSYADITRSLIEKGADINKQDNSGSSVLHKAVKWNNPQQIKVLLECGADISIKDASGYTPLHWAAYDSKSCTYEIIRMLLDNGADCNDASAEGSTPFFLILQEYNYELAEQILDYGADLTMKDCRGKTALHYAAENKNAEVIKFILNRGFNVDSKCDGGFTALHYASRCGNVKGCDVLLKRGANISIRCSEGQSALNIALSRNREMVRNILLQHLAKLEGLNLAINVNDQRDIEEDDDSINSDFKSAKKVVIVATTALGIIAIRTSVGSPGVLARERGETAESVNNSSRVNAGARSLSGSRNLQI